MRVLIVEDDPQVSQLISRQLVVEGCEVSRAGSSEEAIRMAGIERFQLIITDISLPGISGFEAIGALKEAGGAPVLLMTGLADEEFAQDAKLLGAIGLIAKPLESEVLKGFLRGLPSGKTIH